MCISSLFSSICELGKSNSLKGGREGRCVCVRDACGTRGGAGGWEA